MRYFSKNAEIFKTTDRPKTSTNLKLCFIKIAHRTTYIIIYNDFGVDEPVFGNPGNDPEKISTEIKTFVII